MNFDISITIHTINGVDCVEESSKIYTVFAGNERDAINETLGIVYRNLKENQEFVTLSIISVY